MAQATISLINPTVSVILIEGYTIPVDNIAWAGPVHLDPTLPGGFSFATPTANSVPAYRVRFKTEGYVDLHNVTADGFASLLAGAAF